MKHSTDKIAFGDFQTPIELAAQCCDVALNQFGPVTTVIEPTCGQGAFVLAAANHFSLSDVVGYEINDDYRKQARRAIGRPARSGTKVAIKKQDFFQANWQRIRDKHDGSVLFLGNPPWVTNSQLGVLERTNLPAKKNVESIRGIDAMTGRSNFDISESILQTLLAVMRVDQDHMGMLVKTATARKIMRMQWQSGAAFAHASMHRVDAKRFFDVTVDACFLMLSPTATKSSDTQVCMQSNLHGDSCGQLANGAVAKTSVAMGWNEGRLVADPRAAKATQSLFRSQATSWRSGVKHDVSRVLELTEIDGQLFRQDGERVDVEPDLIYPLAKGADVANDRAQVTQRRMLVSQRRMNESTEGLQQQLPQTFCYLHANRDAFANRKSSIYRNRDPYALFGIGDYTFAPWKIAICGLYKRLAFTLLSPICGRPIVVDDTCYTLGFARKKEAAFVQSLLVSSVARQFFNSRIFWDAKRPITAELLRSLDLSALAKKLDRMDEYNDLFGAKEV